MYKIAVQELYDWKQQEKRLQNKLNLTVAGRMGVASKKPPMKSINPLLDESLAKENNAIIVENEKLKTRPSIKINLQGGVGVEGGGGGSGVLVPGNGESETMKSFKDQIKALRKNRKEIKKKVGEDSDGEGEEEEEDDDGW